MGLLDKIKHAKRKAPEKADFQIDEDFRVSTQIALQKAEDVRVKDAIELDAQKLFIRWKEAPMINFGNKEFKNCPVVCPIGVGIYRIYHEPTAEFKNVKTSDLILSRYKELIQEYKEKEGLSE